MPDSKNPDETSPYVDETSTYDPAHERSKVFTVKKDDGANKDEAAIRQEAIESEKKMADMKGFTPPVPEVIKLKHAKPAFTEAIESMFQAVSKYIKQLNPLNKDDSNHKNKPR